MAARRVGAAWLAAALAVALICLAPFPGLAAGRPELKRPVVLSYGLPFPSGVKPLPANLPLSLLTASAIDIGPNLASYPRQTDPDPDLLEKLRAQGTLILRRVYVNKLARLGAKPVAISDSKELAGRWAAALREPGIDGIAIDEFQPNKTKAESQVLLKALLATRKAFPHKYIFIWVAGKKLDPALCRAMRDHADFAVMEAFLKASLYGGKPEQGLARMKDRVQNLMELAPGIEKKTLMGMGIGKPWDDNPGVDYPAFAADQIKWVGQDPVLSRLQGIGFLAPRYADQATMRAVEQAIKQYLSRAPR